MEKRAEGRTVKKDLSTAGSSRSSSSCTFVCRRRRVKQALSRLSPRTSRNGFPRRRVERARASELTVRNRVGRFGQTSLVDRFGRLDRFVQSRCLCDTDQVVVERKRQRNRKTGQRTPVTRPI